MLNLNISDFDEENIKGHVNSGKFYSMKRIRLSKDVSGSSFPIML